MSMTLSLVVVLGVLAQGWCHGVRNDDFFQPGFPDFPDCEGSHMCTTYYNVRIAETVYPSCPPNTDCVSCSFSRWWSWWGRPTCPSCCNNPVVINKVIQRNKTVCCPGYYGWRCNRAFCSKPCTDNTTTCVAPNTCGPACFPECANGGTCVVTENGTNACQCTVGWTGPGCSTAIQCDNTAEHQCQNGGTCYYGRCACARGFGGVFCEKELCDPPCLNGGQCVSQTCNCVGGFTGNYCQIAPDNIMP